MLRQRKDISNGDNEEFTCSNLKSNNLIPLRNVHTRWYNEGSHLRVLT